MAQNIEEIKTLVSPIMQKYHVDKAQIFGSASRGEMTSESDIDILVSFAKPIDGWTFTGMVFDLEDVVGRKVDLVTEKGMSRHIRPYIIPDLKSLYEQKL